MCVAREHLPHVGGETVAALRDRLDELAAASTETLKYFFGTDAIGLSMDSTVAGVASPVRTYARLSDALAEVLDARIYGGMHYRNSTRVGARVGRQVSRFTTRHFFRRVEHHGER
jgi:hypothetical protein